MHSRRFAAVMLLGLAFALAGCFKANVDLTISADGRVDGTMVFAYLRGGLADASLNADQAQARLRHELLADAAPGVACEDYGTGAWLGLSCKLEDLSLDEMNSQDAYGHRLRFARTAQGIAVSGRVDLERDWSHHQAVDITLAVTFPWPVDATTATGQVDGSTVRWTFRPRTTTKVYAFAAAPAPTMFSGVTPESTVPWVALAGSAVAAMALIVIGMRRLPAGARR